MAPGTRPSVREVAPDRHLELRQRLGSDRASTPQALALKVQKASTEHWPWSACERTSENFLAGAPGRSYAAAYLSAPTRHDQVEGLPDSSRPLHSPGSLAQLGARQADRRVVDRVGSSVRPARPVEVSARCRRERRGLAPDDERGGRP